MILQGEIVLSNVNDGAPGQNVVRLDLDNEADTWLTRSNGEDITTSLTSRGRLYDGTKQVTSGFTKELVCEGCEGAVTATSLNPGLMTINVTKVSAEHASATLKVTYKGALYSAVFSVTKSADGGRYVLDVSPSAVQAGTDKTTSPGRLSVSAYYETASGERKKLKPGTDCKIYADGTEVKGSDSTGYIGYYTIPAGASSVSLQLKNIDGVVLDHETVPVLYDGQSASDVRMQYATSADGPWQDSYADGYKWFRISTDGGQTWSAAMKFIGDNGTSVTIKGTALGHFKEGESFPSGLATGIYLQDPMKAYRINGKLLTDVSVTAGDGYLLNGYLYVATPTAWQNVGQIKGDKGEPGVNPACYRLVEMGEGKAEATISLDTAKKGISVSVYVLMKFVVYKYQGDSAERLTDVSGFSVEGYLRNAEEAVMVSRGNDGTFVLTYHSTVSGDDMDDYATVKVALRDSNNKIWDLATFPVVLNNGSVYTRTSQMMESIYSNQQGLTKAEQDAKSIKALVYTHGRNLLYDAGFSDKTVSMDGTMGQRRYSSSGVNTVTFGDDGTALISASGNTENKYTGIFWYVPVNALGKYTASVYDVQAGGFDGDKKAYMSIYACDANKKEKTALGGMMIGSDTDGKRIVLTSADVPEGTPYLELGIYVIKNGTLKIKCPQLERGEEATDWTLRGVEDGLIKAGVDIERGTVTQYGDRFKWMDATGKNMIAGMDSDGNATFNGIVHAKGGEFTGKVTAESGKFAGEIEAQGGKITGDIDVQGTLNGGTIKSATLEAPVLKWGENTSIQLNNGWLEFKGDLLSNYTFRLGDAYVRGWFGAYQRVTLVVNGGEATLYYGNSAKPAMATFQLNTAYYNGITYYQIPCYIANLYVSADVNVAGIPVDTVMLQDKANGSSYNYMLDMKSFQKVTVITVDNNHKSNYLFRNGGLQRLEGGWYFTVHQVPVDLITPKVASDVPGAGQMWSATYDNNWRG